MIIAGLSDKYSLRIPKSHNPRIVDSFVALTNEAVGVVRTSERIVADRADDSDVAFRLEAQGSHIIVVVEVGAGGAVTATTACGGNSSSACACSG